RLERWAFSAPDAGIYRVRVSNAAGFKDSEPIKVNLGCMLSVQSFGPGHVTALPEAEMDKSIFAPGTIVQMTAFPEEGRRFVGWTGDLTSLENPLRITLNHSLRLFANFECLPGDERWSFTVGGGTPYSTPALAADGTLYIGSDDHKLYALDRKSGAKKWEFTT